MREPYLFDKGIVRAAVGYVDSEERQKRTIERAIEMKPRETSGATKVSVNKQTNKTEQNPSPLPVFITLSAVRACATTSAYADKGGDERSA